MPAKTNRKAKPSLTCWAICQFYCPFIMGGNVNQWRRYPVQALEVVDLPRGMKGFVYHSKLRGQFLVHELAGGGFLGEGKSRDEAVAEAFNNVKITPDLEKQIEALGDTSTFLETTFEEADRRLAKAEK